MGPRDRDQSARDVPDVPGGGAKHDGRQAAREDHHDLFRRPCQRAAWWRSHYCASKAGVVMFTKTLAMELAEARINVNCIAPGYIQIDGAVAGLGFPAGVVEEHPVGAVRQRRRTSRKWRCFWRHPQPTT